MKRIPKSLERRLERLEANRVLSVLRLVYEDDIELRDGETRDEALDRLRDEVGADLIIARVIVDPEPR